MALPRETDTYESYTEQLVYFSARLAANPDTKPLAERVNAVLTEIDAAQEAVRVARRAEVRARARRDHEDGLGDVRVRRFKRRSDVIADSQLTARLFPSGISHTVAPRGRPQLDRLAALSQAIEHLLGSPWLAAHAEADEIKQLLDQGSATVSEVLATLTPTVDDWEAEVLDVAKASDAFNFHRADGVGQLGIVIGELRAKLGGNSRAAYAYTQSSRTGASGGRAGEDEAEALDG